MSEHTSSMLNASDSDLREGEPSRRRFVRGMSALAGAALLPASTATVHGAEAQPGCSEWKQPTDADFEAITGKDKPELIDRVLSVHENEVIPKAMEGVRAGNELFGASILN
jgi:hypothetical protein